MRYISRRLASVLCLMLTAAAMVFGQNDSVYSSGPLRWRIGIETTAAWVAPTNSYLRGDNATGSRINSGISGAVRADFSFDGQSSLGRLYPDLYQGIGVGVRSFFHPSLLGTPASVYVYQGAPFLRFGPRLWLGYEWRFGAAMGWKHYDKDCNTDNMSVSTPVTADMELGVKLHWQISRRWELTASIDATHFSNGNTSLPNGGVNAIGAAIGIAYNITPRSAAEAPTAEMKAEADRKRWFYDIVAYGAWRRRAVDIDGEAQLCPGRFGVAGLQFAAMHSFNRWFAAGPALDLQYDESAGLEDYRVEGTSGDNMKFYRPPFGKQIRAGVSAHAELTMPIFAVNAGIGIDFISPKGEKRFYQALALKAFITSHLFINVGYRLGNFKQPQNLMLGAGVRF